MKKVRIRPLLELLILTMTILLMGSNTNFGIAQVGSWSDPVFNKPYEYKQEGVVGKFKVTVYSHKAISVASIINRLPFTKVQTVESLSRQVRHLFSKLYGKNELVWIISYAEPHVTAAACACAIDHTLSVGAPNQSHSNGQSFSHTWNAVDAVNCDADVDQGSYDIYSRQGGSWVLMVSGVTDFNGFSNVAGNNTTKGCRVTARSASNTVSVFIIYYNAE